jgi:ribosome-associated protein
VAAQPIVNTSFARLRTEIATGNLPYRQTLCDLSPASLDLPLRFARRKRRLGQDVFSEDTPLSRTDPAAQAAPATPPAAIATAPTRSATYTSRELLDAILVSLDDDKAEEVVQIDLSNRSAMADHMVVASGRSSRQVAAIAEKLLERLKDKFRLTARVEGKETGDWVLIDTGDVVVHVFRPEVRAFYQLEKMWQVTPASGPEPN